MRLFYINTVAKSDRLLDFDLILHGQSWPIAGDCVASGGRLESPEYYVQNQTIKKPRALKKHKAY
jgi:hypothetical protein